MEYTEATGGRVFVIRLHDGEVIHETVEAFCREHTITAASLTFVGGVDKGSVLVVGPRDGRASTIDPVTLTLDDVYEATGCGTIACNDDGKAVLHMHLACGRGDRTVTGCVRTGVRVWVVAEIVLYEIICAGLRRRFDPVTGFSLLTCNRDRP